MSDVDTQAKDELAQQEAAMEAEFSGADHTPSAAEGATTDQPAGSTDTSAAVQGDDGKPAGDLPKVDASAAAAAPQTLTIEQFESFKSEVTDQMKRLNGTIGGLKSYVQGLSKKATTEAVAAGADTPSAAQVAKAMKDADEYAKMKAEYPEWGLAMDKQMGVLKEFILESLPKGMDESNINTLVSQQVGERVDQFVTNFNHAQWTKAHSSWKQDINSDLFKEWIGKQLPEVQALADSQNYSDGLELLAKFYEHKTASESAKQQQDTQQRNPQQSGSQRDKRLAAAVTPTDGNSRGSGAQAQMSEDEAMEHEFRRHR